LLSLFLVVRVVLANSDAVCAAGDSSENCEPELPEGWQRRVDENGQEFFVHLKSGTSRWNRPTGAIATAEDSLEVFLKELDDLEVLPELNDTQADRRGLLAGVRALMGMEQALLPTPQNMDVQVIGTGEKAPQIYVIDNFLSPEECEFMIAQVTGRLEPANVVQGAASKYDLQTSIRSNEQIWLSQSEERDTPIVRHIIKRMHRMARVPDDEAEAIQVGHYDVGQKYEVHMDTSPETDVARPRTMIVYLSNVEGGGETIFPVTEENKNACRGWHDAAEEGKEQIFGLRNCCDPLAPGGGGDGMVRVTPKRGRAVLFFNHGINGKPDFKAEHAACPVTAGEKWIMQRWFRFRPHQRLVHPPDRRFDGLPGESPLVGIHARVQAGLLDARVLSNKEPRVYLIDDFLSQEEVRHMRQVMEGIVMTGWEVDAFDSEDGEMPVDMAEYGRLPSAQEADDPVLAAIAKRMYRTARVREGHAEELQFVRFTSNASSEPRADSQQGGAVRPMTLLVYLGGDGTSGVGGATFFPLDACDGVEDCCKEPEVVHLEFVSTAERKLGIILKDKPGDVAVSVGGVLDGLVRDHNAREPDSEVRIGSRILSVNGRGQGNAEAIAAELKKGGRMVLKIELARKQKIANYTPSRKAIIIPPKAGRAILIGSHKLDGTLEKRPAYGSCPAGPEGKVMVQRFFRTKKILDVELGFDAKFDSFAP